MASPLKSPGVSTREIDVSGPTAIAPQGVPAGVIGTAQKGRAFVPITFATYQDFVAEFGSSDGEKFGPLAVNEWMKNARAGSYVRVLGIGDGKKRQEVGVNAGRVVNAGFVVGSDQVQENGLVGKNPYADSTLKTISRSNTQAAALPATSLIAQITLSAFPKPGTTVTFTDKAGNVTTITFKRGDAVGATQIEMDDASSVNDLAELFKVAVDALANTSASRVNNVVTVTMTTGPGIPTIGISESSPTCDAGRTYFLSSFLKATSAESAAILNDAGIDIDTETSYPILRGVLFSASGVNLSLSSNTLTGAGYSNTPRSLNPGGLGGAYFSFGPFEDAGSSHGTVVTGSGKQNFTMILNGHIPSDLYSNVITASFDPTAGDYFANVFNTDPRKMEEAGHLLYAHYDVYPAIAVPSAVGSVTDDDFIGEAALLLTGSADRNSGTPFIPNFENFEDRFSTAKTPWFISQKFGGKNKKLFKIHSMDDGIAGHNLFKITIENIAASNSLNYKYGTFDLLVRDINDTDINPVVLESFRGLSLDPGSERFISKIIGDRHAFYDLDQLTGRQKLRIEGSYANASRYIRVETDIQVTRAGINAESLPVGFEGFTHTNTAGRDDDDNTLLAGAVFADVAAAGLDDVDIAKVKEPPVPMRTTLTQGEGLSKKLNSKLTWGVQFEVQNNPADLNSNSTVNASLRNHAKYFPTFQTGYLNFASEDTSGLPSIGSGIVVDVDAFNKNKFTLENIQVVTGSTNKPVPTLWSAAVYRRDGVLANELVAPDGTTFESDVTRFLDPTNDFKDLSTRQYAKFTCMAQGGFDGFNVFDKEKSKMSDIAARREFDDELKQGGVYGPTIAGYRKAIDVLGEKTDVDIQLLAIPGMRHPSITDYAVDAVEARFDAMYIMDIEEKDQENAFLTGSSAQLPSVTYTVDNFKSRNLDTSFAAAYYPDLVVLDPTTRTTVQVPPSVPVLGAFALNDSIAYPWFAPAGFTRGALAGVIETQVKLSRPNMDTLYDADINPITSFPDSSGVVVFGQKTLQTAQTALDRVNVRRLLIEIRRRVRRIANTFIFEPNRAETLARFSSLVTPVLQQIQAQNGVDRFRVQIDTTTTTQADVENNTLRGKIYIQPTRAVEFISIDFVVTNQGALI
jgi:phage tail sheath protein FI